MMGAVRCSGDDDLDENGHENEKIDEADAVDDLGDWGLSLAKQRRRGSKSDATEKFSEWLRASRPQSTCASDSVTSGRGPSGP